MLIDTQRIEDFLKTHSGHIINEEKTLEDKVTSGFYHKQIRERIQAATD